MSSKNENVKIIINLSKLEIKRKEFENINNIPLDIIWDSNGIRLGRYFHNVKYFNTVENVSGRGIIDELSSEWTEKFYIFLHKEKS